MNDSRTLELPIGGMDCAECAAHVQKALADVPGVQTVTVLLSAEKALITCDPQQASPAKLRSAVESAGYSVPAAHTASEARAAVSADFTRQALTLFGIVFGAVLFIVVAGEGLGLFAAITARVPFAVGVVLVLAAGYPIFRNVVRAALKRQVISHTLMTLGVVAALAVGQWATAAVVVFFMHVGNYAERFTAERARRAVKNLTALSPQTARVERDGSEQSVPIAEVCIGETVVVRPGERIPVDGEVLSGQATVDQAAITGEALPVDCGPGAQVFAASLAQLGSLRVRVSRVGADTTFGRVITLVEEAETHRAEVQRIADTFSAYYLPVVAGVALLTFLLRRDPLATAAVLVVACSCSFALATPIAMLASIGAAARRGLLIKGGKYLEALAQADVLLVDKTGTLTLGRPQITDIGADPWSSVAYSAHAVLAERHTTLLQLAACAEYDSEHPLAEAVRAAARERGLTLRRPEHFEAVPGQGVRAIIDGQRITVGKHSVPAGGAAPVDPLQAQGKTLIVVEREGELLGVLAAADTVRPEVAAALDELRGLGLRRIEVLTGDNERAAAALAARLGVDYRANLLPEDKIAVVKEYQAQGRRVVMVGDGVNDAPALAQADIGIAMGAAGADIALEAAHLALMRDDWALVPEALRIARRTMGVVKMNIGFTAVYNLLGLSLAALGFLPPIVAAAAQSLPDIGILANSSRLLRTRSSR